MPRYSDPPLQSEEIHIPPHSTGICFLSDVHLGAIETSHNVQLERTLIDILSHIRNQNLYLIIVGDLFDYWMEYPNGKYPNEFDHILDLLEAISREQGELHYICGNHDNWTNGHLKSRGVSIHKEYLYFNYQDHPFFIAHGDGFEAPSLNLTRGLLNRMLRNPIFLSLYQHLIPARSGINLMRWFSAFYRKMSSKNEQQEQIKLNKWSEQLLAFGYVDVIVAGHDHIPRLMAYDGGLYLNLGDFFRRWTFGIFSDDQLQLHRWNFELHQTELLRSETLTGNYERTK